MKKNWRIFNEKPFHPRLRTIFQFNNIDGQLPGQVKVLKGSGDDVPAIPLLQACAPPVVPPRPPRGQPGKIGGATLIHATVLSGCMAAISCWPGYVLRPTCGHTVSFGRVPPGHYCGFCALPQPLSRGASPGTFHINTLEETAARCESCLCILFRDKRYFLSWQGFTRMVSPSVSPGGYFGRTPKLDVRSVLSPPPLDKELTITLRYPLEEVEVTDKICIASRRD